MSTSKTFNLIGKIICYLLFALGIIFGIMIVANSGAMKDSIALQNKLVLPTIYISYVAVFLSIIVALFLPLFFTTYTKKQIRKFFFILLGVILLFVICWLIPDVKLSEDFMSNPDLNVNDKISKWVGVGCYYVYFMFAFSILAVIYAGISNLIKRS